MKPTHSIGRSERFKNLTNEQGFAAISQCKSIKIKAPAGSGKTTFMMAYAAARPHAHGIYWAFGKPTQTEASKKLRAMGVNTIASTQHSLAYPHFGAALKTAGKLEQRSGMRTAITANLLSVNYGIAKTVNEMLKNYMCSGEPVLSEAHFPDERDFPLADRMPGAILDGARSLWARMTDLNDRDAQATDDVYLKQWANTNPKLPYEFILFDECQDANALTAHIINQQKHCTRVYVGDPHQAIYGFRGAVNLMDTLEAEQNLSFTSSFRFPEKIGLLASTFLRHWKGEMSPIIGKGQGGKILKTDQNAYLARTVAGLIGKGFELHEKGHKMHWIKGFEDYRVAPILEAYQLFKGTVNTNVMDPVIKLMRSWSEFAEYVEASQDADAGPVYRLIEKHRDDIPAIVQALKTNQVRRAEEAPLVLTTAHRAKGLEWPVVRMVEDFFTYKDDEGKWKHPSRIDSQEANLMYVTLTRAQKAVAPTKEISEWFASQPATAHLFKSKEASTAAAPAAAAPNEEDQAVPRAA